MAKDKDPAFMFYPKDWIQGTAEYTPSEKGIMIDLMAHMHQEGSIPFEIDKIARLARIPLKEFKPIWDNISDKWVEVSIVLGDRTVNRLVNPKLVKVMKVRSEKSHKNTIIGTFAGLLRLRGLSPETYKKIKATFNVDDFKEVPTERITERLTIWLENGLKSIANANVYIEEVIKEDPSNNTKYITKVLKEPTSKKFTPPTLIEIKAYFTENDFDEVLAEKVWKGYMEADWHDSQGKQIKNWKQKCQHVWFTDKNKQHRLSKGQTTIKTFNAIPNKYENE